MWCDESFDVAGSFSTIIISNETKRSKLFQRETRNLKGRRRDDASFDAFFFFYVIEIDKNFIEKNT